MSEAQPAAKMVVAMEPYRVAWVRGGRQSGGLAASVATVVLAMLWMFPLVWVLLVSFKPYGANVMYAFNWLSPPFTARNYETVLFHSQAPVWIWNSFLVASATTLSVLISSTLCGYVLAWEGFRGRGMLFGMIAAGLMIPIEATLVPLYVMFRSLGMLDSLSGIILPGLASPFGVMVMKQFIQGLPQELFDAARMDGCSVWRIVATIVVPLCRPALATLAIFTFLGSWNNFLWPYISLTSPSAMTVPVGIPFFYSEYNTDYSLPMAANVVVSIPIVILFVIFQRQIVKGISFTGLK